MLNLTISIKGRSNFHFVVDSFEEASRLFSAYRDDPATNFAASEMRSFCGDVWDDEGNTIGQISYNGRINRLEVIS